MLEMMKESRGNIVGFKAIGTIRPPDYDKLVPMFEKLVWEEGTLRVLMDLSEFRSESPSAWKADLNFGREFHEKIEKLAIVGDKHWEKWMADFCAPFYAREASYFHTDDIIVAWDWLRE